MADWIRSLQNDHLKRLKKLHLKKYRYIDGLFLAEGDKVIEGLLGSRKRAEESFFSSSFVKNNPLDAEKVESVSKRSFVVDDAIFSRISATESPQGVIALVKFIDKSLEEVVLSGKDLVYLYEVRDPGNVGNIIRIADAAGFGGVVVGEGSADIYNPKVIRSTAGSIFNLDVVNQTGALIFAEMARRYNYRLYAADPHRGENVFRAEFKHPLSLFLGGEVAGIPANCSDLIDGWLTIPMTGKAESLNVAAAAAVICFVVRRKKK